MKKLKLNNMFFNYEPGIKLIVFLLIMIIMIYFVAYPKFQKTVKILTSKNNQLLIENAELKEENTKLKNKIMKLGTLLNTNETKDIKKIMENYIIEKNKKIFPELADIISDEIIIQRKKYKFMPGMIVAIIDVESDFDIYAKSSAEALGLMQINYKQWFNELKKQHIVNKVYDLYNPRKNIQAGCYILNKFLKSNKNNYQLALQSYFGKKKGSQYYKKILEAIGSYYLYLFQYKNNIIIENLLINKQNKIKGKEINNDSNS